MPTDTLLAHQHGAVGHLSLNRPKAIHALTLGMCEEMSEVLARWTDDASIEAIILDHAEGRGFCAGGDINLLRRSALEDGGVSGREFFRAEYRLNHQLFTYPKPVVAFMDGITMGGGVGIALPSRYRIATENTAFAMPESGIGLFPDVGGGWYLSRLTGRLGQFLAATGAKLDGAECLWAGIATHYLKAEKLAEAKARIIEHPDRIADTLAALSAKPPKARIEGNAEKIARHFASDRLEDIIASLEQDDSEWAAKELATLRTKSPLACKVALRELAEATSYETFAQNMRQEYRIAARIFVQPDFAEGVRAVIVDKSNDPKWSPASPEGVTDAMLDEIFAPLPPEEEWTPL